MPDDEPDPLAFLSSSAPASTVMKMGGRRQWRVRRPDLEEYIARLCDETATFGAHNPFVGSRALKEREG